MLKRSLPLRRFSTPEIYQKLLTALRIKKPFHSCPHCQSDQVIGHGKYRDRNRYKCKSCNRSFNDLTNTPFHYTHFPHKFVEFLVCIIRGYSLYSSATHAGIHYVTAFYWRHKITHVLQQLEKDHIYQHTSENLLHHWKSPYITFKDTIPIRMHDFSRRDEELEFQKWMKFYQWIKTKYLSQYTAWYRYIHKLPYVVKIEHIERLFLRVCSLPLAQSYQTVKKGVN